MRLTKTYKCEKLDTALPHSQPPTQLACRQPGKQSKLDTTASLWKMIGLYSSVINVFYLYGWFPSCHHSDWVDRSQWSWVAWQQEVGYWGQHSHH